MEAIVCRSSEQIYEDNVLELHTRLTAWTRDLANERCFTGREVQRKSDKLARMRALIAGVEDAILDGRRIDIYKVERAGIHTASMLHA